MLQAIFEFVVTKLRGDNVFGSKWVHVYLFYRTWLQWSRFLRYLVLHEREACAVGRRRYVARIPADIVLNIPEQFEILMRLS